MAAALSDSLSGSPRLRAVISAVGIVVLFRVLFEFSWPQVVIITAITFAGDTMDLTELLPGADERQFRLVVGLLAVGASGVAYFQQASPAVVGTGFGIGGWIALDALYSLRAGIQPSSDDLADRDASEVLLSMQVGHLVADELKTGPKTVPELAAACDMTESRVRETLEIHERSGVVYRNGDRWLLDESKIGPWAFVRDNTHRVVARLLRPFRLFVPS